jgi:hypothetical protein
MAAKFKKETTKSAKFAEGGNGHMFGKQKVGPQTPGVTDTAVRAASDNKFASGGKGKMFGYAGVVSARSGTTSPSR